MVDERDWFRVVAEERCEESGMRAGAVARADLGPAILVESDRWGNLLARAANHRRAFSTTSLGRYRPAYRSGAGE